MQINRLFDIVYILLERDVITAKELAMRFGVSSRTIYRDIDALSAANIPVYADRGKGGGIKLLPGFALSKSMLTEREQDEVLSALQGLRAASAPEAESALSKLSLLFKRDRPGWVDVDFNDWSGYDRRFGLLKAAILEKRRIAFDYFSSYGEKTQRVVEPLQMWFKHRSWYLKAYDEGKQDFRLFKYARMKNLALLDERCDRAMPEEMDFDKYRSGVEAPQVLEVVLLIDASQSYRVYDEFEEAQIEPQPDGAFVVRTELIEDNWLYSFVMGFGEHAKVLAPQTLREEILRRLHKMLEQYL